MLEIIYQDDHLVAINKPSGLLVHRSMIDRHETRFAIQLTRDQIGQRVYPVHRLDKPTSGVLLFALDKETARLLTEQFTANLVQKTYLAIARGYVPESGVIDHALKEKLDKIVDAKADKNKDPQDAVTHYQTLSTYELPFAVDRHPTSRYSLVELKPQTGRKHQLRRHMKHISHHLIGDTSYGNGKHNRFFREQFSSDRLLLHAAKLELGHPHSQKRLKIEAKIPYDMSQTLDALASYNTPSNFSYS